MNMKRLSDSQWVVDRYCEAWSDADSDKREALLADVWAEEGRYTDPTVDAIGAPALLAHIAGVLARRPGAKVARTSEVERHHDVGRFDWEVRATDGTVLRQGVDIAVFDQSGRITRMIGFFRST